MKNKSWLLSLLLTTGCLTGDDITPPRALQVEQNKAITNVTMTEIAKYQTGWSAYQLFHIRYTTPDDGYTYNCTMVDRYSPAVGMHCFREKTP